MQRKQNKQSKQQENMFSVLYFPNSVNDARKEKVYKTIVGEKNKDDLQQFLEFKVGEANNNDESVKWPLKMSNLLQEQYSMKARKCTSAPTPSTHNNKRNPISKLNQQLKQNQTSPASYHSFCNQYPTLKQLDLAYLCNTTSNHQADAPIMIHDDSHHNHSRGNLHIENLPLTNTILPQIHPDRLTFHSNEVVAHVNNPRVHKILDSSDTFNTRPQSNEDINNNTTIQFNVADVPSPTKQKEDDDVIRPNYDVKMNLNFLLN